VSVLRKAGTFAKDVADLGIGFAIAAVRAATSSATFAANIGPGLSFKVRGGESDIDTLRQVFRDNEYNLEIPKLNAQLDRYYQAMLAAGTVPVIIDAGANIGAASVWFKRRFPQAEIVSIEPDSDNYRMLTDNVSAFPGIHPLEAAIGSEAGFVSVIQADQAWGIKTERADQGCPVITIDDAARQVASGELFIVKIDIEGFESDLFARDLAWLERAKAVYVEPHDWMMPGQATSRNFQRAFGSRDFELYIKGENLMYVRYES